MSLLVRVAWRDYINNWKVFSVLVLSLSIGMSGFVGLEIIKQSFQRKMTSLSRALVGGDLQISVRRDFSTAEMEKVTTVLGDVPSSRSTRMLSMVRSETKSRLIQLRGVEGEFPFYGHFQVTERPDSAEVSLKRGPPQPGRVWLYPELAEQLQVQKGSRIQVGSKSFVVDGFLLEQFSLSIGGAAISPRVYLAQSELMGTGLLQKGSTYSDVRIFKLKEGQDASQKMRELNEVLEDPAIRVRSHQFSGQRTARLFLYLTDFLGLVALCALCLSLVGVVYTFRAYLRSRLKDLAIFSALGLSFRKSRWIFMLQLVWSGLVAGALSLAFGFLFMPVIYQQVKGVLPFEIEFIFSFRTAMVVLLISATSGVLVALPDFRALLNVSPNRLFQESSQGGGLPFSVWSVVFALPALIGFSLLSFWLSNSVFIGGAFVGFVLGAVFLFFLFGLLLSFLLRPLSAAKTLFVKLSVRSLLRTWVESFGVLASVGIASLFILLVPFIEYGLSKEFENPDKKSLPSFFLFDIQDYQLPLLKEFLRENEISLERSSPLIRARLLAVNELEFEKVEENETLSRMEQSRVRMVNRGLNLSVREELSESELITQGRWFPGSYSGGVAELSIEQRYAARLGVKMGDLLTIDVSGLEFQGKVTSLRKVSWVSFQPNFFILVQPGLLEEAPKTFVASLPPLNEGRSTIQNGLVDQFPNVSVVDVSRTIQTLIGLVSELSRAMQAMTLLTFFVGLIVLASLVSEQMLAKEKDLNLLKAIGSTHRLLLRMTLFEFGLLTFFAIFVGAALSLLASWGLSYFAFDGNWSLPSARLLFGGVSLWILSLLVCYLVSRRFLGRSPKLS